MWRVVTGVTDRFTAQGGTALSPEWDRGFDEAFTDLVSSDADLVRAEFDALIDACWNEPPASPEPPAPPAAQPVPPSPEPRTSADAAQGSQHRPDALVNNQRGPPR
jgi:hypothetical protein